MTFYLSRCRIHQIPEPVGKGFFMVPPKAGPKRAKLTRIMIKKRLENAQEQIQKRSEILIFKVFKKLIKPLSRLSIRVFETKSIRQIVGLIVVISVLFMALLPTSFATAQTAIYKNYSQLQAQAEVVKTEKSLRLPVGSFAITQGYSFFHPGIDLAAAKGSPVYPIMDGVVIYVDRGRFGYGNQVVIDHGSGFKSLYAHFAKIEAKVGEKVDKNSILGLVGSTGWSTGPHLHLQIWEENRWTNPRAFFEGYFGRRLTSTR